ncbi:hypothetical protein Bca52824_038439 [Brassica carinata]|uniref:NADP-dependent oxidoreductase domain-containing protein n=1 Tax=Brassica carinata TaxID=52824 RepID=A0A8X7RPB0_BRACI|nr:hypothetical protein Bca52824_038439 [Brassica carinata]
MELRPLGNTGLKVSAVGFGASPLGSHYSPVAQDDAIAAVRDHFFYSFTSSRHLSSSLHTVFYLLLMMRERSDEITSKYYGGTLSEKVLGKALKALQVSRGDYIVATKCGRYEEGFDFSAERVRKRHRRELGESSIVSETIPALQKLKQEGKTRFIGITGLPLNIFTYVLDRCDTIILPLHLRANSQLLTVNQRGKKIAKLALQYSLANKAISSVLVGMGSVSEVEENVQAFTELEGLGMDQETLSEVEAILEPMKNLTWPSGIDHK